LFTAKPITIDSPHDLIDRHELLVFKGFLWHGEVVFDVIEGWRKYGEKTAEWRRCAG